MSWSGNAGQRTICGGFKTRNSKKMIDTLYLGLCEEVPYSLLGIKNYNVNFLPPSMTDWVGNLETTTPGTYFHKTGAKSFIRLKDSHTGITFSGPLRERASEIAWECVRCRINIPKLAGLRHGWLPTTNAELNEALRILRERTQWLPQDWLSRAFVKQVDVTMNFDFNGAMNLDDVLGAHALMRHPGVRRDPEHFRPKQKSLYWRGKNTTILLYDKTKELFEKAAKRLKIPVAEIMPDTPHIMRLEFRLKKEKLSSLLDKFFAQLEAPTGFCAPLISSKRVAVTAITAESLNWIFREMAMGFGNLPIRTPIRMTLKTFLAMLIDSGATVGDVPIAEFAAHQLKDRVIQDAKKIATTTNLGSPVFNWHAYMGTEGWGSYARPRPACFRDLESTPQ